MTRRIALPLDMTDPEPLPGTLVQALAGTDVLLLGWYAADPPPAGSERGRRDRAHLHDQAAALLRAGADVSVETTDADGTVALHDTLVDREDVDAVYVPGPISTFGRLLVTVRDEDTAEETLELLSAMGLSGIVHLTLLHVAETEGDREAASDMLDRVADRLVDVDREIPAASVDTDVIVDDDPAFGIAREAADYDAVVMGETDREEAYESVFGPVYKRVRDEAAEPVILVKRS